MSPNSTWSHLWGGGLGWDVTIDDVHSDIARNVTEGPATRAGVRPTSKTVDHGKMMAVEEKIAVVAVVAVKKNWKAPDEVRTKTASGCLFLLTLGSKHTFPSHFESLLHSFPWRMELCQRNEGWRRVILVEEVPSNWQQRWRFWKVSSRIACAAMADLSVSLAELSRKNVRKPWCWDMITCTFCVQKRLTSSLERSDSLACVCEERALRKGWGKSCFTLKFYCPVPRIPRVYAIHFLRAAGSRLICRWFLAM